MAYYGEASERVTQWIESSPQRQADMKTFYPFSVGTYLHTFAYKPHAIEDLVKRILAIENERTLKEIVYFKEDTK